MRGRIHKFNGIWMAEIIGRCGNFYSTWAEACNALCYAMKVYPY
jgi:hypothetical protein